MQEKTVVTFGYGALLPTLEEQANAQGFTLGGKADFLEKLREACTMLMFHVLTDSQRSAVNKKIHKMVMQNLKPINTGE